MGCAPLGMTSMTPHLTRRIAELELDAAVLRHRLLHIPLALQEDCGLQACHRIIGREALSLFRAVRQETRDDDDECDRALCRIEAAYQLVHDAIGALAVLALADPPTRH
ncbi:hypothetical protein SAMN02982917_2487 [Azospirillum oryzae]|uniref:Uncharacterized protein n=2 Tax=Azospirillum oryzae TaxID=286727 RepID=A0A1X7FBL8_9PROT|nr:hypothetical protein SAMN02982917_2487 [Azospirillum oryzae]